MTTEPERRPRGKGKPRRGFLVRLDPAVLAALARWADEEGRSTNAQIESLLRGALARAGRLGKK